MREGNLIDSSLNSTTNVVGNSFIKNSPMLGDENGYGNEWNNVSQDQAREIKAISKKHPGEDDPIKARARYRALCFPLTFIWSIWVFTKRTVSRAARTDKYFRYSDDDLFSSGRGERRANTRPGKPISLRD